MNTTLTEESMATARTAVMVLVLLLTLLSADDANAASRQEEQRCLALSLYWEARGEGRHGMVAVGWTVLNRIHSRDFPATPCEVIREGGEAPPCQFSWWCDGKSDRPRNRDSWRQALMIAAELLYDPPADPTGGSLFYHSTSIRSPWLGKRTRTARIGAHVFYR